MYQFEKVNKLRQTDLFQRLTNIGRLHSTSQAPHSNKFIFLLSSTNFLKLFLTLSTNAISLAFVIVDNNSSTISLFPGIKKRKKEDDQEFEKVK